MVPENIYDIEECLDLALSKMRSVVANLKIKNYRECIPPLYFAVELLTKSLLATKNLYARTHEGVKDLLSRYFIKSGEVSKEVYYILSNLYERRLEADYSGRLPVDEEDVRTYLDWFSTFIERIRTCLLQSSEKERSSIYSEKIELLQRELDEAFKLLEEINHLTPP